MLTTLIWLIHPATLGVFVKTSGTWINVATVLIGSGLGIVLKAICPPNAAHHYSSARIADFVSRCNDGRKFAQGQAWHFRWRDCGLIGIVIGGLLGEWWRIMLNFVRSGCVGTSLRREAEVYRRIWRQVYCFALARWQ
ncbi:hypothetical protein Q2T42_00035 [Leptolyngbya boryana CZ1]|uniref:Uncharacterized protein n=1 Tax=Leptolyngbya boryana CZ1 TaxID=3060204 RepID=A0AA96WV78_LEPBY|nr:hypothetical protein [Leptolyngbya boryana]WNZ46227.1 hypothetical protein Q2T42_00035 [Leptolyngbya boryana CZ1]